MRILGIAGRYREAAAAVAVDGRLVSAAIEGVVSRGGVHGSRREAVWPAGAIAASLAAAGLSPADIDTVVVADGPDAPPRDGAPGGTQAPVRHLDPLEADAIHAMSSTGVRSGALICSDAPVVVAAFTARNGRVERLPGLPDGGSLECAAAALARALGLPDDNPFGALDRLSLGGGADEQGAIAAALEWPQSGQDAADGGAWHAYLERLQREHGGRLVDVSSLNVRVQQARRTIAASFVTVVAERLAALAQELVRAHGWTALALGGGLLAHRRLVHVVRGTLGPLAAVAAVPEATGRALGAALAVPGSGAVTAWPGLALGPSFTEADIKHTLDSCRLDYVYEPDWTRLLTRVSRMLEHGKVVAWFQGAASFGPRSFGTRSILCDPSGRYARHNMNEYLLHVPLDEPLPVVVAPSAAAACLVEPVRPFDVKEAAVAADWHGPLAAALDWRQHVQVHGVSSDQAPELCALLDLHFARTGTPALIEVSLAGPGEPAACTPRDAVRTVYSSAVDALVVGRLLLMKDHWLLRTETE